MKEAMMIKRIMATNITSSLAITAIFGLALMSFSCGNKDSGSGNDTTTVNTNECSLFDETSRLQPECVRARCAEGTIWTAIANELDTSELISYHGSKMAVIEYFCGEEW